MINYAYPRESADALIASHEPLTWEEQVALFATRGTSAWSINRDRLFACYTPMVVQRTNAFVSKQRFLPGSEIFDDILSELCGMLLRCLELFDATKGYQFTTYFYRGVSALGYRHIAKVLCPVTISSRPDLFAQTLGRIGQAQPLHDGLSRCGEKFADHDSEVKDFTQYLLDHLASVAQPTERYVIGRYLQGATLQEIGDELDMHRYSVQYRIEKAIRLLREVLRDEIVECYPFIDSYQLAEGLMAGGLVSSPSVT